MGNPSATRGADKLNNQDMFKPLSRWLYWLVPVMFLPAYLAYQDNSIWTDEAWVANSLLTPSIGEMLFYKDWVQSTPPLVLLAMRATVAIAGVTEFSFRLFPVLAGLGAIVLSSRLMYRLFPLPLAMLGTTFLGLNYWACKYSQQAKQYSTDLLVASAFLYLSWDLTENRSPASFRKLLLFGCLACFASISAVFWFPTLILLLALTQSRSYTILTATLWTISLAVQYFVFVAPNRSERLNQEWIHEMLASRGPLDGALALSRNIQTLLIPPVHPVASWLGMLIFALAIGGLGLAAIQSRKENRARFILLVGLGPLAVAVAVSLLGLFPLLTYPRMIIWLLPATILAICFACSRLPVWSQISWLPIAALCCTAALAAPWLLTRLSATNEDNRPAIEHLKANLQPDEWIYVTGPVAAQFALYRRILNWQPTNFYVAAWGWPCCAKNTTLQATNASAKNAAADLHALRALSRGSIWIIAPAGKPGHYGGSIRSALDKVWSDPAGKGCQTLQSLQFGHTRLDRVRCYQE